MTRKDNDTQKNDNIADDSARKVEKRQVER